MGEPESQARDTIGSGRLSISVTSIGIIASRAIRDGACGAVRCVFERSFYVTLGETWICVGPPGLGEGPLNLLCGPAPHTPPIPAQAGIRGPCIGLSSGDALGPRLRGDGRKERALEAIGRRVHEGDAASVQDGALRIGSAVAIDLRSACIWRPSPACSWKVESLTHGLAAFAATLPAELPHEGLALLLRPPFDNTLPAVARAALASARTLTSIVSAISAAEGRTGPAGSLSPSPHTPLIPAQAGIQEPCITPSSGAALGHRLGGDERESEAVSNLRPLLGLGPGLTPSGDDFLGGAMVALTCLGMNPLRERIWATLAPVAATHTNDVSRAHLAAAAEGYGSAPLHNLIDAIVAGDADAMPQRIAALAAIGHTSGWDAMAGALTVLRAAARD
jgi:hypothetical protein